MKYYDSEYRQELLSFLNGYKNILLYLKEKDEGIAEVLISDNLKKLENHIKIITPRRFDALSAKVKRIKDKQAEKYYNEQIEANKEKNPLAQSNSEIMTAIAHIEEQISKLNAAQRQPTEHVNKPVQQTEKENSEEQNMYEQLELQLEEPDTLM